MYSLQCYTANCHASCVTHFACRLKTLISCMKAKSLTSDSQIQFIIYIVLNRQLNVITKTFCIESPQKSFKKVPNADFVLTVSQHAKACFKRRATAVLSWLDCSSTWFQTSNLIQSNRTAVAKNKTQK